jgi:dipeptidase E
LPPDARRIFAMGGGGFITHPPDPALDEFVLGLARGRGEPRICLLPTAGGDAQEQIVRFHAAFGDRPCAPSHLSLFRLGRRPVSLREHLLAQDIIYVGGGSMLNMLAIWHAHGLDAVMREAWEAGVVLCGLSAGSMCWFEGGITTSTGRPGPAPGLGFLAGSNSVHYSSEPDRRPAFLAAVRDGVLPDGWGVDDGVGLLFEGTELTDVVSTRRRAGAVRVARTRGGDGVSEIPIEHRRLHEGPRPGLTPPTELAELRRVRNARPNGNRLGARRAGLRD